MYSYSFIVFSTIVICAGAGYLCLFFGRRSDNTEHQNGALGYRVSSFIFFCVALQGIGQAIDIFIFPAYASGVLGLSLVLIYSTIRAKDNNWKTWRRIGFLAFLSIAIYLKFV